MPIADRDSAAPYLECLEAMRQEVALAIAAIESNSLERLRESIANQEALCSRMEILAASAPGGRRDFRAAGSPVSGQIFEESKKLQAIVFEYAALLRHSGRTVAVLTALCRSHLGAFPSVAGENGCCRKSLGEA